MQNRFIAPKNHDIFNDNDLQKSSKSPDESELSSSLSSISEDNSSFMPDQST